MPLTDKAVPFCVPAEDKRSLDERVLDWFTGALTLGLWRDYWKVVVEDHGGILPESYARKEFRDGSRGAVVALALRGTDGLALYDMREMDSAPVTSIPRERSTPEMLLRSNSGLPPDYLSNSLDWTDRELHGDNGRVIGITDYGPRVQCTAKIGGNQASLERRLRKRRMTLSDLTAALVGDARERNEMGQFGTRTVAAAVTAHFGGAYVLTRSETKDGPYAPGAVFVFGPSGLARKVSLRHNVPGPASYDIDASPAGADNVCLVATDYKMGEQGSVMPERAQVLSSESVEWLMSGNLLPEGTLPRLRRWWRHQMMSWQ